MKDETKYIERLEAHDVKPTAMRILLLRTMMAHNDAFSLQSLEDVVDAMDLEVARQGDQWHLGCLQAEGLATLLAVEMGMHVIDSAIVLTAVAIGAAHGILEHARSVINSMDEVMGQEQGDGAIDRGLVHRVEFILQALQREGIFMRHHGAQQQDAHRRRLDIMRFQTFYVFRFVLHQYPGF